MTEVTPNLPHCGNFCKYCFMGTLLWRTARFFDRAFFFGVIRGEQPLIRASRASKVAGAFLVLFWHAKENISSVTLFVASYKRE